MEHCFSRNEDEINVEVSEVADADCKGKKWNEDSLFMDVVGEKEEGHGDVEKCNLEIFCFRASSADI